MMVCLCSEDSLAYLQCILGILVVLVAPLLFLLGYSFEGVIQRYYPHHPFQFYIYLLCIMHKPFPFGLMLQVGAMVFALGALFKYWRS